MALFKDKKKPKTLLITTIIDEKVKDARKKGENYFFYPLTPVEVDTAREYFAKRYRGLVEADHKIDTIVIYKFSRFID